MALNLGVGLAVALERPDYLRDYRLSSNPDANHHVTLGRNLLLDGCYSRREVEPRVPDMVRPPVYPVFAGALDILGGAGLIYLGQSLLHAGSCLLLFMLVRPQLGNAVASLCSILLATDLMLVIYNFEAMSELLFVFLILAALVCLVPALMRPATSKSAPLRLVGGGSLLAAAILTRPVGLYLLPILGLVALATALLKGHFCKTLGNVVIMVLVTSLPVGLWIARNFAVFSVPRLSTTDAVVQVYFTGAGAYQVKHGVSLETAQQMIAQEFDLATHEAVMNPWSSDRSVARMDQELRRAAPLVLRKYPAELAQSCLLGVVKASFSHNAGEFAGILGGEWIQPGTGALFHDPGAALERLGKNSWLLTSAFCWQTVHAIACLLLAIGGLVVFATQPSVRQGSWLFLAVLAYFYLTVALFGYEAFFRCRIPALPFLYIFAAIGLDAGWKLVNRLVFSRPARGSRLALAEVKPKSTIIEVQA